MLNGFATKLALRKVGIRSDTFDFSSNSNKSSSGNNKNAPYNDADPPSWASWMSAKNLPLTIQPWLAPTPPPVPVARECPNIGDPAPVDRDRLLKLGGGRRVVLLFMRCVGCACKCGPTHSLMNSKFSS
jgi:hypothetical protein